MKAICNGRMGVPSV